MKYFFLIIILYILSFNNIFADIKSLNSENEKLIDAHDKCVEDFEEKNSEAHERDLEIYIENYTIKEKKAKTACNQLLQAQINKPYFQKHLQEVIRNNNEKDNSLSIYLQYHKNIYVYSDNNKLVSNSLKEIENNYIKKSNLENNKKAVRTMASIGWQYKVLPNHIDLDKSYNFLKKAVKYEKDEYFLSYYLNNLGTVYDQGYGTEIKKNSKSKNKKIAYKLYKQASVLGLHHAHGNLAKMHNLGLGGAEKNYATTIKHLKLARVMPYGDNDFSELAVLYEKKKSPYNLNEWLNWLEEYLIKTQDADTFLTLAWAVDEDVRIKNDDNKVSRTAYKWFYLCSQLCNSSDDISRSFGEMNILEQRNLSKKDIISIKSDADLWKKENWGLKKVPYSSQKNTITSDSKFTDFLRKSLLRK